MAKVQYESKDDAGHKFWTARYGRYAIRIDAKQPGLYRWMITFDGRASARAPLPAVTRRRTRCTRHWRSYPIGCLDLLGYESFEYRFGACSPIQGAGG